MRYIFWEIKWVEGSPEFDWELVGDEMCGFDSATRRDLPFGPTTAVFTHAFSFSTP